MQTEQCRPDFTLNSSPVKEWHPDIGGPTLTYAILDRLTTNNDRLQFKGESLRKK